MSKPEKKYPDWKSYQKAINVCELPHSKPHSVTAQSYTTLHKALKVACKAQQIFVDLNGFKSFHVGPVVQFKFKRNKQIVHIKWFQG